MDMEILLIYLLILIMGICFYLINILMGILMYILARKYKEMSHIFFKNILIGIFGGILVSIILNLKARSITTLVFWTTELPISLLLIILFSIIGLIYTILIESLYNGNGKLNKFINNLTLKIKGKKLKKMPKIKRISVENKSNKIFYGQLLLFVGGFILAETIIRKILSVLTGSISIWALGAYGILLIMAAATFTKDEMPDHMLIYSIIYLGLTIFCFYLVEEKLINIWWMALVIYALPVLLIIRWVFLKREHT